MGFWSGLLSFGSGRKTTSEDIWRELFGGRLSKAGPAVNWETALSVMTVLACVRVIADGVAQIPLKIMREAGGRRIEDKSHPLYLLMRFRPNSWQTPYEFIRMLVWHRLLTGNAFVWLGRVGSERRITVMEPIEPGRVTVRRSADRVLTYEVRADDGSVAVFDATEIWHLRGPSWNGWMGLDTLKYAREAIGLSLATEAAHADLHRNGVRSAGAYSVEGTLTSPQHTELTAWLAKHSHGGENAGKPLILDHGAKWLPLTMSGVDAQHLETRRFQIEEDCRAFGVMPIMIGHSDKTQTYASAEQMFQAHVVHTLSPHYEYIEQSINVFLVGETDFKLGVYAKFFPNALMRGTAKDRGEFYARALGSGGTKGWMTQNDVRDLEDMDRSDDPEADKLPQPTAKANAAPVDPANPQN